MNSQPGWYPDPQNGALQRYWNGVLWSDATRPAPGPAAPVATKPERKTSSPAQILRSLAGIVVVVTVVAFVFNLIDDKNAPSQAQQQYQQAIDTRENLQSDRTILDPTTYEDITQRDFEMILKDAPSQAGRRIILYGSIWHFEAGTGTDRFHAYVGTSPLHIGNSESAHLIGNSDQLDTFVKGDDVKMFVVVDGMYTYTTTADRTVTVPQFQIGIIELAE